jgi:ABC-type sugar transport system permease subunit
LNKTPAFIGLGNFVRLAQDGQFLHALGNTGYFTLFTVIGETVISLLVAFMMNEQLRGRLVLRTAFFLPVVTSWVIVSIMWSMLFAREGLVNGELKAIGLPIQPFLASPVQAMWVIIALSVWKNVGYFMVIFLAGLQGVPQEIYEAASLDGARGARLFTRITIPMVSPSLFFLFVVDTIGVLQTFTQIHILTRGGPVDATRALVYSIYLDAFQNFQFGYASAQAVVLFALVLVLTLVQFQVVERRVHYQ